MGVVDPKKLKFADIRTLLIVNGHPLSVDEVADKIATKFGKRYPTQKILTTIERFEKLDLISPVIDPEFVGLKFKLTKDGRGVQKQLEADPEFTRQSTSPNV
jgi:hypothetical protein